MEIERFIAELASRMEAARLKDRTMHRRFFAELAPRLETARALEAELDRRLARRFNVFDYAKTDELGISHILADLLDPQGPHGQATLFLERFVEGMGEQLFRPDFGSSRISVTVEKVIPSNRRIDVYVQIGNDDAAQCLAIENKPYAGDQENQVKDYLKFLADEYGERFILIYLSPRGEGPSNWSIPKEEIGNWKGRFAILPYCTVDSNRNHVGQVNQADEFEEFRLLSSLADWFHECRRSCEVDRLRWFLRDAEIFCQREFGGPTMTIDSETKLVTDFLLSEPEKNLATAYAVYKSWPTVREKICEKFLRQIRRHAEKQVSEFAGDIKVKSKYGGRRSKKFRLWLYRSSWTQHKAGNPDSLERIAVCMEVGETANRWYFGITSPRSVENMTHGDKKRSEGLKAELKKCLGSGYQEAKWPWWNYVENRKYGNWEHHILDLYRETEKGCGKVTKYFVDLFIETAKKAIPIIDKFNRENA